MLYNVVVNDWGETTYVPTALGNVLLVVVLIALLAVAVVFARKQRTKTGASDDGDRKMAHGCTHPDGGDTSTRRRWHPDGGRWVLPAG